MNKTEIAELEKENELLKKKTMLLEKAIREVEFLIDETGGIYWSHKHNTKFVREVGNLKLNTWHDLQDDTSRFNYLENYNKAISFLRSEKEET